MKNLKRIFSTLLIGAMALTLLVGCGGGSTTSFVQYIGEGTTILDSFIASGDAWAAKGDIDIIENDALRALTEKWAGEASLSLTELCDSGSWEDPSQTGDSYADNYINRPFSVRCGNLLSAEGVLGENSYMDTSVRVIGANTLTKDQLNTELTDWLKGQDHITNNSDYTPSDAALHVYLVTSPTNENQKAWVAFLVVAGPLNT